MLAVTAGGAGCWEEMLGAGCWEEVLGAEEKTSGMEEVGRR